MVLYQNSHPGYRDGCLYIMMSPKYLWLHVGIDHALAFPGIGNMQCAICGIYYDGRIGELAAGLVLKSEQFVPVDAVHACRHVNGGAGVTIVTQDGFHGIIDECVQGGVDGHGIGA